MSMCSGMQASHGRMAQHENMRVHGARPRPKWERMGAIRADFSCGPHVVHGPTVHGSEGGLTGHFSPISHGPPWTDGISGLFLVVYGTIALIRVWDCTI